MTDPASVHITAEITPNPNTMRFVVNRVFLEFGTVDFPEPEKAKTSKLASRLFKNESVIGVLVGKNFITVTKKPAAVWEPLVPVLVTEIRTGLLAGENAVPEDQKTEAPTVSADDSPVVQKIKKILDQEIRPAVAMDGGDITFLGFKDGILTLNLQGSCSSCPSSVMTLKMGVETRMKAEVPEVREVINV